jgi:hypothetical protein
LNEEKLNNLSDYLLSEVEKDRFLMLNHSSIAILRRIIGYTKADRAEGPDKHRLEIKFRDIYLETLPLFTEGIEELTKYNIVSTVYDDSFVANIQDITRIYTYQSIIKAFDHTIMSIE